MDELKKDEQKTDQKRNQEMPAGKPGDGDKMHGDKKCQRIQNRQVKYQTKRLAEAFCCFIYSG